jgi:hypothetical protein
MDGPSSITADFPFPIELRKTPSEALFPEPGEPKVRERPLRSLLRMRITRFVQNGAMVTIHIPLSKKN